jgi:hypothetical protein
MPPSPLLSDDEREVLDHHDQRQRPEDQRQDAEDVGLGDRDGVRPVHALLERVERRRADVAVDDAERAERQLRQVLVTMDDRGVSCPVVDGVLGHLGSSHTTNGPLATLLSCSSAQP